MLSPRSPASPLPSPVSAADSIDSSCSCSSSVGRRIMDGLKLVRRKLTFDDEEARDEAAAAAAIDAAAGATPGQEKWGSLRGRDAAMASPAAANGARQQVECESMRQVKKQGAEWPAEAPHRACPAGEVEDDAEDLRRLAPSGAWQNSEPHQQPQQQQSQPRRRSDWGDGLPPDFVERLASHLKDSCVAEDWASVQNVYNAASVCRTWRDAIQRTCFQRSPPPKADKSRSGVEATPGPSGIRVRRKSTLVDRMLCHPGQLMEKAATEEDLIQCYIVREKKKPRAPLAQTKYKLILGPDYSAKDGKTLLVAYHQLLATRSVYSIYTGSERKEAKRLGQLESTPYGTSFELYDSKDQQAAAGATPAPLSQQQPQQPKPKVRRTRSGSIQYTFNMLGGRGPRSVEVKLAPAKASEKAPPEDDGILLENKLPRWHELLQCWCLDFGGRVKQASVKNMQLVGKDDPDEIILQFGKVEQDVFTMDFKPKYLSPKQAFSVCLSSFDSKLSCF